MPRRRNGLKLRTKERNIKIALKRLKKEIPKFTKCTNCGECCGPIIISPLEIQPILRTIRTKNLWPEVAKNILRNDSTLTEKERLTCPLLRITEYKNDPERRKTECMVYKNRPIICRLQGNISPELQCKNGKSKQQYKKSKWFNIIMNYISENKMSLRETLLQIIIKVTTEHEQKTVTTDQETEENNMADMIDEQQKIDEKRKEKMIVTGDKIQLAKNVTDDTKDKVVND